MDADKTILTDKKDAFSKRSGYVWTGLSLYLSYHIFALQVRKVVGPWASGSFQAVFNYHTISAKITEIIQRADTCRQIIHYNCKNAKITGVAKVYDKNHQEIVLPCSCANTSSCTATPGSSAPNYCNCDALGAAENNDTQVFENKALMPISKVTVNGLTSASDYLQFLVGPVECFEGMFSFDNFYALLWGKLGQGRVELVNTVARSQSFLTLRTRAF